MALAPRTDNPAKDMAAIMAQARNYPDSRLADVLAGKDMSIPQYVAMAEAMGRRNLRQAVDGAQAQQQAQQPSVKEQLLAEQNAPQMVAGIDQLPAANMESMDLAGGGIIAFEGGGGVPGFYEGELIDGFGSNPNAAFMDQMRIDELKRKKDIQQYEFLKDASPVAAARMLEKNPSLEVKAPIAATPDVAKPDVAKPDVVKPNVAAPSSGLPAIDVSQATKFERRTSPFGQMSAEKVDFEGLKNKGLGEGLMKMGAGLLSAPGSRGFAAGIQALADSGAVSRKEINALKKDARDYDFNIKRAETAFEQGQDELGLKYTEAANLNKFRIASLNQKPNELRTLEGIAANPELAAIYKGGKNLESYSLKDATDAFNKLEGSKLRELKKIGVTTPAEYRQYVLTNLPPMQVVGTIPGKDAVVRN